MTAAAGLIATHFGPAVGGLFLAFPAIFPASATLIEKHEREKKVQKGLSPGKRGRRAAGAGAAGAAMGSFGLLLFAIVVWQAVPRASAWLVLAAALLTWLVGSLAVWWVWKRKLWR